MKVLFVLCLHFLLAFAQNAITPIPQSIFYNKEKALLGKELFFETALSKDGTISCASCHNLPGSGADGNVFSSGMGGDMLSVNTPTVLNSVFNFRQFWDGRAKDLYEQALMPIINPQEMDSNIDDVIAKLNTMPYKEKFAKFYIDGITQANLAEVIAEFEKALITPNSKFDRFLKGEVDALNEQEKRGYKAFSDLGCISCHNGVNIGGNMYQKIGVMMEYNHLDKEQLKKEYLGRYRVTKRDRDMLVFKVPTLRNIALSAPYLHDGSAKTLRDAIIDMREHQLGITQESSEIDDIEAFLKTLTGDTPEILQEGKL